MATDASLDLSNVPFFKLIYSMILRVHETIWCDSKQANKGRQVISFELARVFKSLTQSDEKNVFIQKLVQSKIKETLLRIETCTAPEIEAVMSIVHESAPNHMHVGAACSNTRNQIFTVIGFSDKDYTASKNNAQGLDCGLEFDPANSRSVVYGLYFDANSPERQEIIDCKARETQFVRDISEAHLLNAARNSPFFQEDVIAHFLQILQGTVTCGAAFTQSLLVNYIIRGMNNMI